MQHIIKNWELSCCFWRHLMCFILNLIFIFTFSTTHFIQIFTSYVFCPWGGDIFLHYEWRIWWFLSSVLSYQFCSAGLMMFFRSEASDHCCVVESVSVLAVRIHAVHVKVLYFCSFISLLFLHAAQMGCSVGLYMIDIRHMDVSMETSTDRLALREENSVRINEGHSLKHLHFTEL